MTRGGHQIKKFVLKKIKKEKIKNGISVPEIS